MIRLGCLLLGFVAVSANIASACTFCAGGTSRPTLREQAAQATVVLVGELKNPRFSPDGDRGTTEFHPRKALKSDPRVKLGVIVIPQYIPVVADTPPDFILFCAITEKGLDPFHGIPSNNRRLDYVQSRLTLTDPKSSDRLVTAFPFLDSADEVIATDAYLEFAKAPDKEIVAIRDRLKPAVLERLLANNRTPRDRIGVFAMLYGLCANRADAHVLSRPLDEQPISERVRENLGGYLAGLTLLDPALGWGKTEAILADVSRPFDQRLAALGTIRFFQMTGPVENQKRIVEIYRGLVRQGDLADLVIEDLRRWGCWDLSPEIVGMFGKPGHDTPLVRRAIVRYARSAPDRTSQEFLARVRVSHPDLVATVEESMKLYEAKPITSPPK